jgi:hypothetical protein
MEDGNHCVGAGAPDLDAEAAEPETPQGAMEPRWLCGG